MSVRLCLKIQYKGDRARKLGQLKNKDPPTPGFLRDLHEDLSALGMPHPHTLNSCWQSGSVECDWRLDRDSELYVTVMRGYSLHKFKLDLESRCVSWMKLTEDGQRVFPSSASQKVGRLSSSSSLGRAERPQTSISAARHSASAVHQPAYRVTKRSPPYYPKTKRELSEPAIWTQSANHIASVEVSQPKPSGGTQQALQLLSESTAVQMLLKNSSAQNGAVKLEPVPIPLELLSTHPVRSQTFATPSVPVPVPPAGPSPAAPSLTQRTRKSRFSANPTPSWETTRDVNTNSTVVGPLKGEALSLTRDLWDIRRQLAALKAREHIVEEDLKGLGVQVGTNKAPPPSTVSVPPHEHFEDRKFRYENKLLREQLEHESDARKTLESALLEERRRRMRAEGILDDARRECSAPFVVPALMEAFVKLAQLTGEVI